MIQRKMTSPSKTTLLNETTTTTATTRAIAAAAATITNKSNSTNSATHAESLPQTMNTRRAAPSTAPTPITSSTSTNSSSTPPRATPTITLSAPITFNSPPSSASTRTHKTTSAKMLMINCYLILISMCALTQFGSQHKLLAAQAKPLNQNQVKFRRLPPKEFSAALGSSITIECEAGASPPATIHWLKNGKRISQNEFDDNQLDDSQSAPIQVDEVNRIALGATRSRLFIDCADYQDEAVYTCVAENAYSRVSSHTRLNLIKPPVAIAAAPAAGSPAAAPDGDNDLLASVGPLSSDEVAALELAANGDGAAKPTDKLSAVPQCLSQRNGARATVRIHMWTHNIVEIMKNNLVLYCRSNVRRLEQQQQQSSSTSLVSNSQHSQQQQAAAAAADQEAAMMLSSSGSSSNNNNDDEQQQQQAAANKRTSVSWTLPDDKLVTADQKDKYEILETGDLLIKDLRWSDMGSYVCTVSDDQSSDSISAFVYPASVKANNSKRAVAATSLMSNFNR